MFANRAILSDVYGIFNIIKLAHSVNSSLDIKLHLLDLGGSEGVKVTVLESTLVHFVKNESVVDIGGDDLSVALAYNEV